MDYAEISANVRIISENIEKVIIGKKDEINLILAAMLAGGHVLLEDMPGTGKTELAKSLAKSLDCRFSRVQFTPDLLPSDLTGIHVYSPKTGDFTFREGSLFANIILADEINRATPRTQAGLLESMEEKQISVDGETFKLPPPYFVIATQNPIETQGTFPLPEAQLDRFLIKLSLGYPKKDESIEMVKRFLIDDSARDLKTVCGGPAFVLMQESIRRIYVHSDLLAYITELGEATRGHVSLSLGVSSRALLGLTRIAQAYAAISGRDFVTPSDIQYLLPNVFGHRIITKAGAGSLYGRNNEIIMDIIKKCTAPTEDWEKL